MELTGITAVLFVALIAAVSFVLGMAYAAWVFMVRAKKAGYTFNERIELVPLKKLEVSNG